MIILPKTIYRFSEISVKNPHFFCSRKTELYLQIHMELHKTLDNVNNFEHKEQ